MTKSRKDIMIYSGYENGRYFVRLTHDMRMLEAMDIFHDGYKLLGGHMLLLKKRDRMAGDAGFRLYG